MAWVTTSIRLKSLKSRRATPKLRRVFAALSLAGSDTLVLLLAYWLFRYHRLAPHVIAFPGTKLSPGSLSIDVFLICAAVFLAARLWSGDYTRRTLFWEETRETTHSLVLLSLIDIGVSLASAVPLWPHIVGSWIAAILLVPIARHGTRRMARLLGLWDVPAALVGSGPNVAKVYSALKNSLALGFDIREVIHTRPETPSDERLYPLTRWSIEGEENISQRLIRSRIEQVIIVPEGSDPERMGTVLQHLVGAQLRVLIVPQMHGIPLLGLKTTYLFGHDLLLLTTRNNLARLPSRIIKRLADFFGAAILISVLTPLLACIAIAIKWESRGPALFIQERVGRNETLFPCFKFRTMVMDAEAQLAAWREQHPDLYEEYVRSNFKLKQDPRVTKMGQWLRRTSLDELPQLFNVLVGHMSLVGPRPLLTRELPDYGAGIDLYYRVRPGITGLWQTRGRSDTRFQDRVTFDEWYILNWSFWYDIVILLQTAWIVGSGKGAY
ncbi:MAG: undecaprenyl-phosphate galactose phosphotransferase WbaP [Alphaproteobacteria bacterium]|nr:undecaprenyl-phosphate galactose phosphotransferase WbaP [Alphaproteobacteria bacterium]